MKSTHVLERFLMLQQIRNNDKNTFSYLEQKSSHVANSLNSNSAKQTSQYKQNMVFWKKKVIMILNISTDFKFNIYSRGTVISGCLFKWNIKKEYWISNRVKVKKKYINSTSWVYMYKSDFWKRALVYYLFLSIHLETS